VCGAAGRARAQGAGRNLGQAQSRWPGRPGGAERSAARRVATSASPPPIAEETGLETLYKDFDTAQPQSQAFAARTPV
jgi:hypothetical protein